MSRESAFEPRNLLFDPDGFGLDPDAEWRYAVDEMQAIRLHRSREQHELAREINATLAAGRYSIPDLAGTLGYRRENLWRKLTGETPATETDLIRWTWLTGAKVRPVYPLHELTENLVPGPVYPVTRRRKR